MPKVKHILYFSYHLVFIPKFERYSGLRALGWTIKALKYFSNFLLRFMLYFEPISLLLDSFLIWVVSLLPAINFRPVVLLLNTLFLF